MNKQFDITVRRATLVDAKLLTGLGAQTFRETFAADNTEEDMDEYLAANFNTSQQSEELNDAAATFLIAEVESIAAGYAKLKSGPAPKSIQGAHAIELVRLYVSKEWLGRGVGAVLMRKCLDEASKMGFKTIWLGVWERNARAQAFYRKWDFQAIGEHPFQLGSDLQTDIVMERTLE